MSGQQQQSPWVRPHDALRDPRPGAHPGAHLVTPERNDGPEPRANERRRRARAPAGLATILILSLVCVIALAGVTVGRLLTSNPLRATIAELRADIKTARRHTAIQHRAATRQATLAHHAGGAAAALRVRLHRAQSDARHAAQAANDWRARALTLQRTLKAATTANARAAAARSRRRQPQHRAARGPRQAGTR